MRSTKRQKVPPNSRTSWHEWFAWHPVRAKIDDGGWYRWVWLDVVERRLSYGSYDHKII